MNRVARSFQITPIGTAPVSRRQATMLARGLPDFLTTLTLKLNINKINQIDIHFREFGRGTIIWLLHFSRSFTYSSMSIAVGRSRWFGLNSLLIPNQYSFDIQD
ncbi:MAG: hypothetical protein P8K78_04705 [Pirellulales bacterium]|nr:hypothetical protein [Pirellulales bacterium]